MDIHSHHLSRQTRLALSRTMMAGERTLLAYIRTAMTFIIAGIGVIRFFQDGAMVLVSGIALIAIGIFTFGAGFIRHRRFQKGL